MPRTLRHASPSGSASLGLDAAPAGKWHGGIAYGTVSRDRRGHSSLSPIPRGPKSHHNISPALQEVARAGNAATRTWLASLPESEVRFILTGRGR